MTDPVTTFSKSESDVAVQPRQSPLLIIGTILWVLCLVGIVAGWYQWRKMYLARQEQLSTSEDDGRSGKTLKLVLQKDGSFAAREVGAGDDDSPWDPNGIEDFSFTDTDGNTVTKQDLLGKPFIISFIFTYCRGPCPNVTNEMREIHDRLQDYDFNLVSLTVDPQRDTQEVLKAYGKVQQADFSRWKFLTGDQAAIYGFIQRSFAVAVQENPNRDAQPGFEVIHSTNIMLVDASGRVVGKFNAQRPEEMSKLRKELKQIAALKTASPPNE